MFKSIDICTTIWTDMYTAPHSHDLCESRPNKYTDESQTAGLTTQRYIFPSIWHCPTNTTSNLSTSKLSSSHNKLQCLTPFPVQWVTNPNHDSNIWNTHCNYISVRCLERKKWTAFLGVFRCFRFKAILGRGQPGLRGKETNCNIFHYKVSLSSLFNGLHVQTLTLILVYGYTL